MEHNYVYFQEITIKTQEKNKIICNNLSWIIMLVSS
ncbi:Hypothetical protein EIN_300760, partial [Entamoeba invadens IP1]